MYRNKIMHFFRTLNWFPSTPPSVNNYDLRNERISTRLFIILLIFSLTILLLYNSLVNAIHTINREKPSLEEYLELYSTHSETLTCPCKQISTSYKEFVHIDYTLHQICTSVFISQEWFQYLAKISSYQRIYQYDFLLTGSSSFQALNTLCQMSNRTISNSLTQFYSNQYVATTVTSSDLFLSQFQTLVDQFILSTTNNFLLSFYLIRLTTSVNQLMTASRSNYIFDWNSQEKSIKPRSETYYGWRCDRSAACISGYPVKSHPMSEPKFIIPSFYVGCYIIEAVLQSTLECFYDQACISRIQSYITYTSPMNVTALDPSLPSQYFVNSTIQNFFDHLMVEQWNKSITYEKYYNHCQPKQCTYTYKTKNTAIDIVTILFGLVGGLVTILQFIVPRLVKLIAWIIAKRRRRIIPQISTIRT